MIRRLLLAAILELVGWQADAAIGRNNNSGRGDWCQLNTTGHINSPCGSITVVGSDTIVIVDVTLFATSGPVINFVQINGVSCSGPYKSVSDTVGAAVQVNALYYCLSPAAGAVQTVSVDYTGTGVFMTALAVGYSGVDASTPFDTGATGNSSNCTNGTSCALATTVNNAGDWLHEFVLARNGTVTGGTNTTLISGQSGNGGQPTYADSNGTVATGSRAANWTAGAASDWPGIITVALCPTGGCSAAAHAVSPTFFFSPF